MSELPKVVHENGAQITQEAVAAWEAATDKTLEPAQIERLMIDLIAYRELLVRFDINDTARQNLIQYARDPMLSYLAARVDTWRLPPQPARTTLRYSIEVPPESALSLPQAAIAGPSDARWLPQREPVIQPGQSYVDVPALASIAGSEHNALLPGSISEPTEQMPVGVSVRNFTVTSGGTAIEDIERFRQRAILANARPAAGSRKQYRYIAMSAHQRVIDVSVQIVSAGHVRLALLIDGDEAAEILALVDRAVRRDDNRPTTDNVDVVLAEAVQVPLAVAVTPRVTALVATVERQSQQALTMAAQQHARTLGLDVVQSDIHARIQSPGGIKRVVAEGADVAIAPHQYAVLSWNLTITGAEDD